MSRLVLIARLAVRDLRHRRTQAVLLLAITAATATLTLTLGLALNGVTSSPYLRTKAATRGPDITAFVSSTAQDAPLSGTGGVSAHSGPYPLASAVLRFRGLAVPVQTEGRDEVPATIDQPDVTEGSWIRPGSVVLERTFAEALGVTAGDRVTLNERSFRVSGIAVTAAIPEYPGVCYYMTCRADSQAEESGMGRAWVTQAAARGFATPASPVSYVLNLRLRDPRHLPNQHHDPRVHGRPAPGMGIGPPSANQPPVPAQQRLRHHQSA